MVYRLRRPAIAAFNGGGGDKTRRQLAWRSGSMGLVYSEYDTTLSERDEKHHKASASIHKNTPNRRSFTATRDRHDGVTPLLNRTVHAADPHKRKKSGYRVASSQEYARRVRYLDVVHVKEVLVTALLERVRAEHQAELSERRISVRVAC